MALRIAREFRRFIETQRSSGQLAPAQTKTSEGQVSEPIFVELPRAVALLRVAARQASGLFRPTQRTEVVWTLGESELAIAIASLEMKTISGFILVYIPVRCDQTGTTQIEIAFAVGHPDAPAGLYASTFRRPNGPPLIVEAWGEALVAFAWQCLLGLISGVAGASGKDARGNVLVPVELSASDKGIHVVPMARHRFAGSSGLRKSHKNQKRGAR
jgi:hypothetical protein